MNPTSTPASQVISMGRFKIVFASFLSFVALSATVPVAGADPYLDAVRSLEVGANAGFGGDRFPKVLYGPPRGRGLLVGSTHVLSLGRGGSITAAFNDNIVIDGPGADLAIYENAFHVGSEEGPLFTEYAIVEVSADARTWHRFPFDAETGEGLAGRAAVISNPSNGIDPLSSEGGGDRFDLADLGVAMIRYVRVSDGGDDLDDYGNLVPPGDKGGFDLDAMGALNSSAPGRVVGRVTSSGAPVHRARVKLVPADGSRKKRRWTDSDGRYRFGRLLPVGDHEIRVRKRSVGSADRAVYLDLEQLSVEADFALD